MALEFRAWGSSLGELGLPLVSREWKNGSNSSYNWTPFLHSLLAKGKLGLSASDVLGGCGSFTVAGRGIEAVGPFLHPE